MAEEWALKEVHPASDKDRAWAVTGFLAGARAMNEMAAELVQVHHAFDKLADKIRALLPEDPKA